MSSFKVLHSILRYLLFSIFICIPVNYVAQTNYNAPTNSFSRLLDVVAKVESNNNPKAIGPVTKSGRAKGMYQFTDATAKQFGIDPFDPVQAREGASKYIQQLLKKYDGDLVKALAAYNWGPGNVDKYGLDKAPKETRDYLFKINKGLLE